ncbi:homocysteine S-methyltransferase family protein [Rhizobium sp. KVB221]|uniref:Homocysteine S-methyltransferase family protein n=1 Tax=Rhizobium setariae TaxID=2801340 RepID=A0A937CQE1_9HYPH|nr:homocysteine S-methyltransferase family protein [Rhizobium setariae]MBL0372892.1 homocysteine S-methyltransferase family protein [Rhizobium setariae]
MAKYRHDLPQLKGGDFLTDGGMETTFVFHRGMELPHFASFPLLDTDEGRAEIVRYFEPYIEIARTRGVGFILDSPTWRANPDWGPRLGYDEDGLIALNIRSIEFLESLRRRWETPETPIVLEGVIGPRGDGYKAGNMDPADAEDYHSLQIEAFSRSSADVVAAFTMNTTGEAIGIARAAKAAAMPCVISFTVETDGGLVNGTSLREAIELTEEATGGSPIYYMVNCAHPTHFDQALKNGDKWVKRIVGIRANSSTKSHQELDESTEIDIGDPVDLGRRYRALRKDYPDMRILGGCCGTDHRHLFAICEACAPTRGMAT